MPKPIQKILKFDGQDELKGHRFHIRVDSQEKGVLIIDASKLIFLNGTAVEYIVHILSGHDVKDTFKAMRKKYRKLNLQNVTDDYTLMKQQLQNYLAGNPEIIDVIGSEDPLMGADDMPSPYRMDIALTYRCQNNCGHCYPVGYYRRRCEHHQRRS